ncbi:MAG: cell wall-binding repeat-containing protein, partial [Gracilibacteraceae bacterium]|nr:cell wall-binding repeat-containing protein [Gracilibacteraceae bacterium]
APLFPAALHAAGPAPDGSSVTIAQIFPDPILADWVAQKLVGKDKNTYAPSAAELAGISGQLSLSGQTAFTDWTGIRYLTGLTGLNLDGTNVTGNLSELAFLSGLTELRVKSPNVAGNISALNTLTNLTKLNLEWTLFSNGSTEHPDGNKNIAGDIADIANLTNLTELELGWTGVNGDLADIAGLTGLSTLSLSGTNTAGDLAALSGMTDLEVLWLDMNMIPAGTNGITGNLSDLTGLTKLTTVGLSGTAVAGNYTDLLPLSNLYHLNMYAGLGFGNISNIAALSNLCSIWLGGELEGDIAALAGRTDIVSLSLHSTRVYGDLSALSGLTSLITLDLTDLRINLPPVNFSGAPLAVPLPNIKDETGTLIAPQEPITGGTYAGGQVTWAVPAAPAGTLSYTFSKAVTINGTTGTYSGTVYQPYTGGSGVSADITNGFTDANFLAAVRSVINKPSGPIYDIDVASITSLDVTGRNIASLAGIKHFTALESLYCYNNLLTTLDVSDNAALEQLYCAENQLSALDVSQNSNLSELNCGYNPLKTLDTTNNDKLKILWCFENELTSLDVSGNPALESLWLSSNQLTDIDVSNNPALKILGCQRNQLTNLDLSHNSALELLNCSGNQLLTLNLSHNTALARLYCQNNFLTALNLSNNPNLIRLWVNGNKLPSVSAIAGLGNTQVGTDETAEMATSDLLHGFDSDYYVEENGVIKYPKFHYTPQNTSGGTPGSFTLTQAGAVYGGQPLANPQVRGANSANIDYTYSGTLRGGVTAYGPTAAKPSEAGDYSVAGVDKTTGATASVSFTIAPKALTLTGLSVETKTYDRTTAATLTGTPVLTGKVGADDVSVDRSGEAAVFDNAAAGANKNVSVTGLILTGAKAFNYTLPAALTLKGEIKALSAGAGDAPLITPDFSTPVELVVDTPPPYGNDPAADEQMWKMVYTLREDTAFRSVTPESSANLLFMDLALVLKSDGTTPYGLKGGESLNVVFPYPSDAVAQNYKNYRFVLLHYTKAGEAETIPAKAESYGVEATLTELSPYALAWTQVSSGSRGGGGGGAVPVEPVIPGVTVSKASLTYISGINRVETSVAISRQGWTSAETVIIAPGGQNNLIDALAVAPLAGQEKAPILLSTGSLDPAVVAEIQRLGAKKVYAVGAINQTVIDALEAALPGLTIETLRGANRFETASLINARVSEPKGTFIVGYNAVADAVSAASFAAANGYAIQIASPDGSISAAPTGTAYILGGPTLVSDVAGATRLYGATRYETNKAVRDALAFDYTNIYTADGGTLVDALTGSALAAQSKAAIVLLPGNDPTGADFGKITQETKVYAFGAGK